LRDNVGGAIDLMQYFLGPFIGPGQYAYDFYHQDNYTPFKTKTGWLSSLVQYKKVVILINGGAQSSAEVMAAALKKYNVGILVGEPTKGWGTVERVFDIERQIDPNRKFSALIVHSITLRDDGQPIEGRGVEPLINIKDRNWQSQLMEYFNYPELTKAVKEGWDSFVQS
jgi:carboxyl-terminal processing protease